MALHHLLLFNSLLVATPGCSHTRARAPAPPPPPPQITQERTARPASLPTALKRGRTTAADVEHGLTGIAECDEFLVKYTRCVWPHVNHSEREELEQALDEMRIGWTAAASNPSTRKAAAVACRAALDAARRTMSHFGCSW